MIALSTHLRLHYRWRMGKQRNFPLERGSVRLNCIAKDQVKTSHLRLRLRQGLTELNAAFILGTSFVFMVHDLLIKIY